jgi:hypothetical protein
MPNTRSQTLAKVDDRTQLKERVCQYFKSPYFNKYHVPSDCTSSSRAAWCLEGHGPFWLVHGCRICNRLSKNDF